MFYLNNGHHKKLFLSVNQNEMFLHEKVETNVFHMKKERFMVHVIRHVYTTSFKKKHFQTGLK